MCNNLARAVLFSRSQYPRPFGNPIMLRKLLLLAVVGFVCGATAIAADDEKKPTEPAKPGETKPDEKADPKGKLGKLTGKLDKGKLFDKLDANGDGKLTKDEFKKFAETITEKLKDKGKVGKLPEGVLGDKLYDKMDANKDGSVTKGEFEKADLLGGMGKKGEEKKPEEKKPEEKKPEEKKPS